MLAIMQLDPSMASLSRQNGSVMQVTNGLLSFV